jgi:phosphate transport system substrate-binding protein
MTARRRVATTFAILALAITGCNSTSGNTSTQSVTLLGAGSTFIYPAMSRWARDYAQQHSNVQVNYQSIGSGGGIQQVKNGTVDFGASDAPLSDQQLSGMKPILQIPESAGPVCITYNLPNLGKPLQLSAEVISGIFLGTIASWRDPQIIRDNPGVNLPNAKISVAHRADGSGTTAAFTTYLSAVSPEWKSKIGSGTAVSWPVGVGGKGSEGVTASVKEEQGGIGYVELTYAQENKLPVASIKNQAGQFIAPSVASTTAAIAAFATRLAQDPRSPIVNAPASAPNAYPISTLTFLLIPKDGTDRAKRTALKNFIQYVITSGQSTATELNYASLPQAVQQYDQTTLSQMTINGQPIQ